MGESNATLRDEAEAKLRETDEGLLPSQRTAAWIVHRHTAALRNKTVKRNVNILEVRNQKKSFGSNTETSVKINGTFLSILQH
jgi:hypothetical protein